MVSFLEFSISNPVFPPLIHLFLPNTPWMLMSPASLSTSQTTDLPGDIGALSQQRFTSSFSLITLCSNMSSPLHAHYHPLASSLFCTNSSLNLSVLFLSFPNCLCKNQKWMVCEILFKVNHDKFHLLFFWTLTFKITHCLCLLTGMITVCFTHVCTVC